MASKLPQIMESVNGAADCAETLASGAASGVSKDQYDDFWRFREDCRESIDPDDDDKKKCVTANDCYCSYSTCVAKQDGSGEKECKTADADYVKCEAECFSESIDPVALRFLKQAWDVPANDKKAYVDTFVERMTDDFCIGEKQHERGIGEPGVRWVCDDDCRTRHACNSWSLIEVIRQERQKACDDSDWTRPECDRSGDTWQEREFWNDFERNQALCESYGGTHQCASFDDSNICRHTECRFDPAETESGLPCQSYDECREALERPCRERSSCEAAEGTWIDRGDWGDCCAPGAFVGTYDDGHEHCTWRRPSYPPSWELSHKTCCEIYDATWRPDPEDDGRGQCCYGEFETHCDWQGDCWTHCNDASARIDCWDDDACDREDCKDCEEESRACCGEKFVPMNEAECLKHELCNNPEYRESWGDHYGESCDTDESFCGQCWGSWCWPETQPSKCIIGEEDAASCALNNGTFVVEDGERGDCHRRDFVATGDAAADGRACFATLTGKAEDACPAAGGHYLYEPAYPWHSTSCYPGCYYQAARTTYEESSCGNWWNEEKRRWSHGHRDWQRDDARFCYTHDVPEASCKAGQNISLEVWMNDEDTVVERTVTPSFDVDGRFASCRYEVVTWDQDSMDCVHGGHFEGQAAEGRGACKLRLEEMEGVDYGPACDALGGTLDEMHGCFYEDAPSTEEVIECGEWDDGSGDRHYGNRDTGSGRSCYTYDISKEECEKQGATVDLEIHSHGARRRPDDGDYFTRALSWVDGECTYDAVVLDVATMECAQGGYFAHYEWIEERIGFQNGACRKSFDELHGVVDAGACAAIGGSLVPYRISFEPGRFETEAQCSEGLCENVYATRADGSLEHQWGGYTREQCDESPGEHCDRHCRQCKSRNSDAVDGGLCFDEAGAPLADEGRAACVANGNHIWADCSSHAYHEECEAANDAHPALQCYMDWDACQDEASCDAAGECSDRWENRLHVCEDPNWAHGDTCWASYEKVGVDENGMRSYEWIHEECSSCKESDGVCVEDYKSYGCDRHTWHMLGCRVFGVHTAAACAEAPNNARWLTSSSDRAACESTTRCYERWYGHSSKDADACAACGGVLERAFEWHGGRWSGSYTRDLTWFPRTAMGAANVVTPRVSDRKVESELAGPLMRAFAASQRTELYLKHTMWTSVVKQLLCDCGEHDAEICAGAGALGSVAGKGTGFCGLEEPMQAGCASVIFNKTCGEAAGGGDRRRLAGAAPPSDTVEVSFGNVVAGEVPGARRLHSATCVEDLNRIDAYVVKNAAGAVVGQLAGDGLGIAATSGDFDSVDVCLKTRVDLTENLRFATPAVARYDAAASPAFAILDAALSESSAQKFCATVDAEGTYFPVYVSDDLGAANSAGCGAGGVSVGATCLCFCGYSGPTCADGCPNSCSGRGTCGDDGACACEPGRGGDDCGVVDCPTDAAGRRCSWVGTCNDDATCACPPNFSGDACEVEAVTRSNQLDPPEFGYGDQGRKRARRVREKRIEKRALASLSLSFGPLSAITRSFLALALLSATYFLLSLLPRATLLDDAKNILNRSFSAESRPNVSNRSNPVMARSTDAPKRPD